MARIIHHGSADLRRALRGTKVSLCNDAADQIEELEDWLRACLGMVEGRGPPNWDGIREILGERKGTST